MTTAIELVPDPLQASTVRSIRISPWRDPVVDPLGFDPRRWYVEHFWLAVLGPTTTWLMRRFVSLLESSPDGYELDAQEMARSLGLGGREGRHAPFLRAVERCVSFGLARRQGPSALAVRRRIPPLPRRHLLRLPPSVQQLHEEWELLQCAAPALEHQRRRSRMLALDLFEIGEGPESVEMRLVRWRVHPALAYEASQWAEALCRRALAVEPAPSRHRAGPSGLRLVHPAPTVRS